MAGAAAPITCPPRPGLRARAMEVTVVAQGSPPTNSTNKRSFSDLISIDGLSPCTATLTLKRISSPIKATLAVGVVPKPRDFKIAGPRATRKISKISSH